MTQEQIATRLEAFFSHSGFAEPSVAELKAAAGVSLRTLYRYFPSKDSMVIGALQHRHSRYLTFLSDGAPKPGLDAIHHVFDRLAVWMRDEAPNGCMSMSALAAFPGDSIIRKAVEDHKGELIDVMAKLSGRSDLASELFLLHEGGSSAWPLLGMDAIRSAQHAASQLFLREQQ